MTELGLAAGSIRAGILYYAHGEAPKRRGIALHPALSPAPAAFDPHATRARCALPVRTPPEHAAVAFLVRTPSEHAAAALPVRVLLPLPT